MTKIDKFLSITLVVLMSSLVVSFQDCCNYKKKADIAEHNTQAALDTVSHYKDKYGQEYAEKLSYISSVKDLKSLNEELYTKVKNSKQNVIAAGSVETTASSTILIDTIIYTGSSTIPVEDDLLKGILYLQVLDSQGIKLDTFQYKVDVPIDFFFAKENKLVITSPNKKVHITQIQSFIIPEITKEAKKKHWVFGPTLSFGVDYRPNASTNFGYGFQVGIGVMYKFIEW
jgi:hypothetical protein